MIQGGTGSSVTDSSNTPKCPEVEFLQPLNRGTSVSGAGIGGGGSGGNSGASRLGN